MSPRAAAECATARQHMGLDSNARSSISRNRRRAMDRQYQSLRRLGGNLRAGYAYTTCPQRRRHPSSTSRKCAPIWASLHPRKRCCCMSTNLSRQAAANWRHTRAIRLRIKIGTCGAGSSTCRTAGVWRTTRAFSSGYRDQLRGTRTRDSKWGGRRGWSAQIAVTNGTASGPEEDHGKQFSLRAEQ